MNNEKEISTSITHRGDWIIDRESNLIIECYVTSDKRRLLSLKGAGRALELKGAGSTAISRNLKRNWIQPYLSDDLKKWVQRVDEKQLERIEGFSGKGIIPLDAELFVDICKAYVNAQRDGLFYDKKGNLQPKWIKQNYIADKLYMIMSAFAKIGIVALIDEITGYQEDRDRDELYRLLAVYLSEERLQWAKMFPDTFYRHLYRLKGWQYPTGTKRTPMVGKLTNQLVYEKLPEGVLRELRNRNPVVHETKRRRWKHFQFLSEDIGQPDLRDHLLQLIAIMKASANWSIFQRLFRRAFRRDDEPEQLEMPFMEEQERH
jgi:hypothetical protein